MMALNASSSGIPLKHSIFVYFWLTRNELDENNLRTPSIGKGVVKKYTDTYHTDVDNQNQVSRSEKDVEFPSIRASGAKVSESANQYIKRATSTIVSEIQASGTVEEIYAQFEKISRERTKARIPKRKTSVAKKVMCSLLSSLRKHAFHRNAGLDSKLEQKARDELALVGTSFESRSQQLEDLFCSLEG